MWRMIILGDMMNILKFFIMMVMFGGMVSPLYALANHHTANEKTLCGMTQMQAYHQLLFDADPKDRITHQEDYQQIVKKAYQGDLESQMHLGELLAGYDKTQCFFKMVAKHDDENGKMARYVLSRYYGNGFHGFPKSNEEQFYWLEQLALIEPEAYYMVGFQYYFTILKLNPQSEQAKNYAQRAIHWYLKASQDGEPRASEGIARLYGMGLGVDYDSDKAIQWLHTAIEQSLDRIKSDNAHFEEYWVLHSSYEMLGDFYFDNQDYEKAMMYYQNDINIPYKSLATNAYYMIGQMYEKGLGVSKDSKQAKHYYKRACKEGVEKACQLK